MDPRIQLSFERMDIQADISHIERIFSTGVLSQSSQMGHPLKGAAFVMLLIHLRNLMYKAEKHGTRIDFKDDVIPSDPGVKPKVEDVTDLVKFVRDAICHPDIDHHYVIPQIKSSFSTIYGKMTVPMFVMMGQAVGPSSDYDDDIAFCFGQQRIYLVRHIYRAFDEAKKILEPIINPPDVLDN